MNKAIEHWLMRTMLEELKEAVAKHRDFTKNF